MRHSVRSETELIHESVCWQPFEVVDCSILILGKSSTITNIDLSLLIFVFYHYFRYGGKQSSNMVHKLICKALILKLKITLP